MVQKTTEWIVQTRVSPASGWSDASTASSWALGLVDLAAARRNEPQHIHRMVFREPGCPDAIMSD